MDQGVGDGLTRYAKKLDLMCQPIAKKTAEVVQLKLKRLSRDGRFRCASRVPRLLRAALGPAPKGSGKRTLLAVTEH